MDPHRAEGATPRVTIARQLVALFVAGVLAWSLSVRRRRRQAAARRAAATVALRDRLLRSPTAELGIAPRDGVCGVLMEFELGAGKGVTLVALGDGTASLYFSNGGGIIGAGGHAPVREAVARFCAAASRSLGATTPTTTFPPPTSGVHRFYILTPDGVRVAEGPDPDVRGGSHALSPLFTAGNDLVTEIRLVEGARDAK